MSFDETWNVFERKIPQSTQNIIIILGQGLNSNGEPSDELLGRINLSVSTFHNNKQYLSFDNTVFIVTGGDISNHQIHFQFYHKTEAHIMSEILHKQHNIPLKNIYWDYHAKETIENFFNVLQYIRRSNIFEVNRVYIVTSDYHMERSLHIFNTLNQNPFTNSNMIQTTGSKYKHFEQKWLNITQRIYPVSLETNTSSQTYTKLKGDWSSGYLYRMQSYLWTAALYNPQYEFHPL